MLQLNDISLQFAGDLLYKHVDLIFQPDHCYGIIGANGAGKSTLLRIISGQDDADSGRIVLAKGARIGYLEQEAIEMGDNPIFEEVLSAQVEILNAERRLKHLEEQLGANPTESQLAAAGRARDEYELLGGYTYELSLFGYEFGLVRQGLALFALLPIWLYRGEQGYHPRWMRYLFYGFYPAHLLVLGLLKFIL